MRKPIRKSLNKFNIIGVIQKITGQSNIYQLIKKRQVRVVLFMKHKNSKIHKTYEASSEVKTLSRTGNIFNQILALINSCYELRFIQKISRPIDSRTKEQLVEKYAGMLQEIHLKMNRVPNQFLLPSQKQYKNSETHKKCLQSTTDKPYDKSRMIKKVQQRYTQVFIEGSLKHYPKIRKLNNFQYELNTINIHEWSQSCINITGNTGSCC